MKMEQAECSETSEYKIQTSGNYPEENIQLHHFSQFRSPQLCEHTFRNMLTSFRYEGSQPAKFHVNNTIPQTLGCVWKHCHLILSNL